MSAPPWLPPLVALAFGTVSALVGLAIDLCRTRQSLDRRLRTRRPRQRLRPTRLTTDPERTPMTPTPQQILALSLDDNDADAATVRDYLIELLLAVWREGEGFSGKRPFGNSSWEYELYLPLIKAGWVRGELDEDGYIEDLDDDKARDLIETAIKSLAAPEETR